MPSLKSLDPSLFHPMFYYNFLLAFHFSNVKFILLITPEIFSGATENFSGVMEIFMGATKKIYGATDFFWGAMENIFTPK